MTTFLGIIVAIVGLGFLILVHELGHFIVAKATGIRVEEFCLGFGPRLVSRRIGETVYGIAAIPLGGYVRVTGMHKEEFEARIAEARQQEAYRERKAAERRPRDAEDRIAGPHAISADEIAATPLERRYYSHPLWHKLLFIVAGVAMNMVVAVLLIWIVGLTQGEVVTSTVVEAVEPGTPAAAAGIQPGDRVVSIAGKEIDTWEEVRTEILTKPGQTVVLVVERAGELVQLTADILERPDGTGYLGVQPAYEHRDLGIIGSLSYAARTTWSMVALTFKAIGMMFTGEVPVTGDQGLAGPLGIIDISVEAFEGGYYLMLLALISINLAILNMLPLLPLDGGHVLWSIIERVRGRSLSLRTFERISMVGLAIFVLLFFVATANDISRLVPG